ncbi:MAG: amidohydrolase family protein [Nocardioides sp.]|nr:amidohydrolase family protein [Nocardioides sp.]
MVASGPPVTTPGGHCHFLGGAVVGSVRSAVLERAEHGVDVIKVMASGGFATPGTDQFGAQFTREELGAIVDEAHRLGLPVVAHAHSLVGIENAVAGGVDGIEHFTGLTAGGIHIGDDVLAEVARRGVVVDLTLGTDRAVGAAARMPTPPPTLTALMRSVGVSTFEEFLATRIAVYARLGEHGIPVVAGVDSGMGPFKPHGSAWRTVVDLVEGGYPPAEALAAATSYAAEVCGLGEITGRLATGYAADILVVDGDPASDPAALGRPLAVHLRGRTPATATASR